MLRTTWSRAASSGVGASALDEALHVVEQLDRRERLAEEVVGTGLAAGLLDGGVLSPGGQHQHLDLRVVELAADLDAVEPGHDHVEHDDHRAVAGDRLERLAAGGGLHHVELVDLQDVAHYPTDRLVVVNHQHEAVALDGAHFSSDSTLASPVFYRRVSSACRASLRVKRA